MTVDFHLSADLPEDPAERMKVRAEGIALALKHAAADPGFRLDMILGEAYARYRGVVDWLASEIEREGPSLQAYAVTRNHGSASAPVAMIHAALLADATNRNLMPESTECPKSLTAGSTDC